MSNWLRCNPATGLFGRVLDTWGRTPLRRLFPAQASIASVFKVIGGNFATSAISFFTSILIARWTSPYDLGVWNAALLVTVYAPILQVGVFNGLNRELPYFIGSGDKAKAQTMAESAFAWCLILAAASVVLTAGAAAWFGHHGQRRLCYTAMAVGANVICYWVTLYLTTTYRTNAEFGRLAQNTVAVAMIGVGLVLLVWFFRYEGILLRASLLSILGVGALYYRRPMPVRPRWNKPAIVHLVRIGLPIWLAGQAAAIFIALDRMILVRSPEMLGYFTIAIQTAAFARTIPAAFTIVLYPQMAHRYGETHNAMAIWQIAKKGAIGACLFGLLAGCCGWFLAPHVVKILVPKYLPGAVSAQWASFMGLAMGLYVFDNVYVVIGKLELFILNYCIGAAIFFVAWFLLTRGFGAPQLIATAQSMLLATLVMAVTSLFVSHRACSKHDRRLAELCLDN